MTTGVVNLDDSLYVAVQRLHGAPDTAPADKLRAIARLRAPGVTLPADLVSASLVAALSDGDDGVRAAAATACLERFDKLAAAPPDQAALLDGLLRGIHYEQSPATARTLAEVIGAVGNRLAAAPTRFPHLVIRLLDLAEKLNVLASLGDADARRTLASAILSAVRALRTHTPSGPTVALIGQYSDRLKERAYRHGGTPAETLLEYLAEDQGLRPEALTRRYLLAYRALLASQAQAPHAVQRALLNLRAWLEQVPHDLGGRLVLAPALIAARQHGHWQDVPDLPPALRFHLLVHMVFLPGPAAPDDLLRLLRDHYTRKEPAAVAVLVAGLDVLGFLPGGRARLPEICAWADRPTVAVCGEAVQLAIITLLSRLLTGLEATTPEWRTQVSPPAGVAETVFAPDVIFGEDLEGDRAARALLARWSADPARSDVVRTAACDTLLRILPPNRLDLYHQALHDPAGLLFEPALAAARDTRQRDTWRLIEPHWAAFTSPHAPDRPARLARIIESVATWSVPASAELLIALAIEDRDRAVREDATRGLIAAGFRKELDFERARRALDNLQRRCTKLQATITRLEGEMEGVRRRIDGQLVEHHHLSLDLAGYNRAAAQIVTEHMLATSAYTVRLHAIQDDLQAALREVGQRDQALNALREQVERLAGEVQTVTNEAEGLHRELRAHELQLVELKERQRKAQAALPAAQQARADAKRTLDNAERELQRRTQAAEASLAAEQAALAAQADRSHEALARAEREMQTAQATLEHCRGAIPAEQDMVADLRRRLAATAARAEQRAAEEPRRRAELANQEGLLAKLRGRIEALTTQSAQVEREAAESDRQHRDRLAAVQRNMQQAGDALEAVGKELRKQQKRHGEMQAERDAAVAEAHQVAEQIAVTHAQLDTLASEAGTETGRSQQAAYTAEQDVLHLAHEQQAALFFYAHDVATVARQGHHAAPRRHRAPVIPQP